MLETIPSPGDLPDPGIEPRFPTLKADALTSEPPGKPLRIISLVTLENWAMCLINSGANI